MYPPDPNDGKIADDLENLVGHWLAHFDSFLSHREEEICFVLDPDVRDGVKAKEQVFFLIVEAILDISTAGGVMVCV